MTTATAKVPKEKKEKKVKEVKEVIVDTKQTVKEAVTKYPEMKWYLIQTASKAEDAAKRNILEQLRIKEKSDKVGMILIPEKKISEMKDGKKKITKVKNYPTYMVMLADMDEGVMMCTREASKVSKFIGKADSKLPVPLTPLEINRIIAQLDDNAEVVPTHKIEFKENESVTINDGPFESFEAVINKVNYEKELLDVSIIIFGRATPLSIGFKQVTKIA